MANNKTISFQRSSKSDAQRLSLRQIQLEELRILEKLISICEENRLTYYLYGGTALGAIRHGGFIPWDDDIDVIMPRLDYERFLALKSSIIRPFELYGIEKNNSDSLLLKMINRDIVLKSNNNQEDYLWIDIFPIDGLPSKKPEKYLAKIAKIRKLYKAIRASKRNAPASSNFKNIIKKPLKIIPLKPIAKRIIKKSKKYKFEDSEYVCDTVWAEHRGNILKKEWLNKTIKVKFEGIEANVFRGYKNYLEKRYGRDYMVIPSKEKQVTHDIEAYKVDE